MTQLKSKNDKVKIYLADLVHNWVGRGPFMFPINIGYLKSYLNKFHGDDLETRLFKYPDDLIKAVEKDPPNIIGLSNYAWNEDLGIKLINYFKFKYPSIVTVMGGPNVSIPRPGINFKEYDTNPNYLNQFLRNNTSLDFYVVLAGEQGFLNLVNRYLESDMDIKKVKMSPIEGIAFLNSMNDEIIRGNDPLIFKEKNLDYIPSPYLTGIMDEFFYLPLIPNLETDRGCPYPCTFCVWGDTLHQKMAFFPEDRVKEELKYIVDMVKKTKKTNILCMANANFGIVPQDFEYSKLIRESYEETGYPRKLTTFWAKNKGEEVIKNARVLGELVAVDASLQSTNPATLKAIKRDNISQDDYKMFLRELNKMGIDSDAELIMGLPEETRESFLNGIRDLFNEKAGQIIAYHCRILKGAEMSDPRDQRKYGVKTKWRLIDTQYGGYKINGQSFKSIEAEEMVKSNNTTSEEDLFYFRDLSWLMQFTWNYKYHRPLLEYLSSPAIKINSANFLDYALSNIERAPKKVQKLMREFREESKSEWFPTRESLVEHYTKPENWEDLKNGSFGKLNFKYTFKTLLECANDFDDFMNQLAKELIPYQTKTNHEKAINDITRFQKIIRIDFSSLDINKEFSVEQEKIGKFNYDILQWGKNAYEQDLQIYFSKSPILYRFYLPQDQVEALNNNINQFKNINSNFTLRKMGEYMRFSDLFYKVESLSKPNLNYKVEIENQEFHTSKYAQ
jgi:radical SAM superfamily enzyme YgiQ (UPF0313 family)